MVVSDKAWRTENTEIVFGESDDDWVLIGFSEDTQPFVPLLLARGEVTLSPEADKGNTIAWTNGLYIVRNENPEVATHTVKGAYQLTGGRSSLSADALVKPDTDGVSLNAALPISLIQDVGTKRSGVNAAFLPDTMLLTTDKVTRRSSLRFTGTQAVSLHGSRFSMSVGGSA